MNCFGRPRGQARREGNARLVDLRTGIDTATATFTQTCQGKEKTNPIEFNKVDGEWKISQLPRLTNY